jgi:hypothetical protein
MWSAVVDFRRMHANNRSEIHPDWDTIVAMSYSAGLGNKGVGALNEHLFPREHFPSKYDRNDQFRG